MTTPQRGFFTRATLGLCGSLEIEQGLWATLQVLKEYLPADALYLQRYAPRVNAMHVVARARAGAQKGERLDTFVPLDDQAMTALAKLRPVWVAGELPTVIPINDPRHEPVTLRMLDHLNEPLCSALSMPLVIEDQIVGTLVILAEGPNRFTEEHMNLFAMLKEPFFVAMSNVMRHREVLELKNRLLEDNRYLHRELHRLSGDQIIGSNFGLKAVMEQAGRVAPLDSAVLLLGETGVGKDVIANAIHYSSPRKEEPFVKLNCGAIPDTLLDSELFGHEKGAFTGAVSRKKGCFERADHGTVFLDEIGELPAQAQVRLLRVLQDKEIQRVGGDRTIALDVRVIAATNRDLEQMVREGTFRQDLWFRLNVFPIKLPPLRERRSDIPALVQHFVAQKAIELKLALTPEVRREGMQRLMAYDWPGNVRELVNIVERSLILNPRGPLTFEGFSEPTAAAAPAAATTDGSVTSLDEAMAAHIRKALEVAGGKIHGEGGAARMLGINANTLRSRMKKLGIQGC